MTIEDLLFNPDPLGMMGTKYSILILAVALVGSMVSSLLISYLYVVFFGRRASGSGVHGAFPLIGISITAIFIAIQYSLPLSLGLLGALSIVRFRTPIKEPEEIGFILVVVATSLAWATLKLQLLGVVLVAALISLVLTTRWKVLRSPRSDGVFVVTLPLSDYAEKGGELLTVLSKELPRGRIESLTEGHDESVVSYGFDRIDQATVLKLQEEMRRISSHATSNVFFNRTAPL